MSLRQFPNKVKLVFVAFWVLVFVRTALSLRKTGLLETRIARYAASNSPVPGCEVRDLREVSWSVSAASRLVPGATCLTQAFAGSWLLGRRGHVTEIRLTLPVEKGSGFRPHAWLMHGDVIVLGGPRDEYIRHRPFKAVAEVR
ncbi:lasso peptide biosynthesis B2 protein [Palleronia abyssalis]|uniref:lasso peptide biosynthesis B2 protein n=1 Tax=Palleronia abyssalis TaxID=1501240 RepID=UPI000D554C5B|nr:lasso peptide biosynthesis B2 protein [Palleronia abyssalis]